MSTPTENLIAGFTRLPAKSKLGLIGGLAALAALVAVSFMWGRAPEYRVLFSNLSDRDGGAIIAALGQMNVPYKFAEGGGAILVPAEQVHDARLKIASQGLPRGASVGFELMDSQKFGVTQFQEQVNYQRSLEGELSRSIHAIGSVQSARVHLAIPKPSVFLREQQKPTASVLVTLHPGRNLDRAQLAGIVHLVASSVPDLPVKNVSVLDQAGNLLSSPSSANAGLDPAQLNYVRELESGYMKRITDILEPIVGRGNVRAQVNAEVDFSQAESTAEMYKPNGTSEAAAMRTQSVSESGNGAPANAQGVPGAASNQPGAGAGNAAGAGAGQTRKDSQTNYEVDRTIRHVKTPTGAVKRLSAAIVVNHRRTTGADGKAATEPLKKEEIEQLQALAREAMGINTERGDTINLTNAAFTVEEREVLPELPIWQQPENIALAKDVGKGLGGALLILYVLFGLLRPMLKSIAAPQPALAVAGDDGGDGQAAALEDGTYSAPPANRLEAVRNAARQDPRVVANVVRNWTKE
jgi:flagellar M-ring protein FliF